MKKLLHGIAMLLAASAATALSPAVARDWDSEAARRKAAYIFVDAQTDLCEGGYSDYYMKLRRANALDPADIDIAAEYAELLLQTTDMDSAEVETAYEALRRRFLANPGDFATATPVAELAAKLGKLQDVAEVWKAMGRALPSRNDPSMNLADTYVLMYMHGDSAAYDSAMTVYGRLEQGLGFDVGLSSHKIRALMLRRDTTAVEAELQRILRSAPADPDAMLYAGQVYESLGMRDSALTRYDAACRMDSTDGRALMMRADLHLRQGDSAAYDTEVFRALESRNLDFDNKMQILGGYIRALFNDSTQWGRIDHLFGVMDEVNPGEARLHSLNAVFLSQTNRPAEGAEQAGYAVDLDPENADLWMLCIQLLGQSDNGPGLVAKAAEASARFPDRLQFPVMAAGQHFRDSDYGKAMEVLGSFDITAVDDPEQQSTYWTMMADAEQNLGLPDSTVVHYERALTLNPHNYGTMNNYAYYLAKNDTLPERAEHYAALAVKNEPENATYLDTYAWVFFRQKDYTLARRYIDAALRIMDDEDAPPSAEVLDHAGDIYFMCGEREQALEFWHRALELEPDNPLIKKKNDHKTIFFE